MTSPLGTGYPDYGRYQARAQKIYDIDSSSSTTSAIVILSTYVGDVEYLQLRLQSTDIPMGWEIAFYADSGQTQLLAVTVIDTTASGEFNGSVAVAGPYLRVRRLLSAAVANTATWAIASASSMAQGHQSDSQSNVLIHQNAVAIAAGATNTYNSTRTWPGLAVIFASMDALSWHCDFYSRNYLGTNRLLCRLDQSSGSQPFQVLLPPTPLRVEITNNDGSAHTLRLVVTSRPMFPGV